MSEAVAGRTAEAFRRIAEGPYADGFSMVRAMILSAIDHGADPAWAYGWIVKSETPAGDFLRNHQRGHRLPRSNPSGLFDKFWWDAERYARRRPPVRDRADVILEVARIRDAADAASDSWRGMAGRSDRAVLEALLCTAERVGSLEVHPGDRLTAERAGVSRLTAARALGRLAHRGFVRRVRPAHGEDPAVWALRRRAQLIPPRAQGGAGVGITDARSKASLPSDAFRWTGLGKAKWQAYAVLDPEEGRTTAGVAGVLGVGVSIARKHLAALRDVGLAERLDDGTWIPTQRDLEEVGGEIGTAGVGAREQARHREERERYRRFVRTRVGRWDNKVLRLESSIRIPKRKPPTGPGPRRRRRRDHPRRGLLGAASGNTGRSEVVAS